jgi:hypothetical protein
MSFKRNDFICKQQSGFFFKENDTSSVLPDKAFDFVENKSVSCNIGKFTPLEEYSGRSC